MQLIRNESLEKEMQELVVKNWENRVRVNIALTDLLQPRKAYFQRKFPTAPTLEDVLYFLSGKAIEKGLGDLIGYEHPEAREVNGIWYNPDFRLPSPTELKSRRANLPQEGFELEKLKNYVDQLFGYCSLDDVDNGNLVVFALAEKVDDSHKTKPKLVAYKFICSEDERKVYRELLQERKLLLEEALKTDDISKLIKCEEWKCFNKFTKIVEPPICDCNKTFANDYLLSKHLKSAKGKGHTGTFSIKEYTIEPKCIYYDKCTL